jgi:hypothetical protein
MIKSNIYLSIFEGQKNKDNGTDNYQWYFKDNFPELMRH